VIGGRPHLPPRVVAQPTGGGGDCPPPMKLFIVRAA